MKNEREEVVSCAQEQRSKPEHQQETPETQKQKEEHGSIQFLL
jgi:hypothetical protein